MKQGDSADQPTSDFSDRIHMINRMVISLSAQLFELRRIIKAKGTVAWTSCPFFFTAVVASRQFHLLSREGCPSHILHPVNPVDPVRIQSAHQSGFTCLLLLTLTACSALADSARLKDLAAHYEKEGLPREAAATYEKLLEAEPTTRRVITPKLVQLYIDSKQPAKALTLDKEFMHETPDAQAYLAGVYASVGGYKEAEAILRKEIAGTKKNPRREATLHWQLADLYTKSKQLDLAEKTLEDALETGGSADKKITIRRLSNVRRMRAIEDKRKIPAGSTKPPLNIE